MRSSHTCRVWLDYYSDLQYIYKLKKKSSTCIGMNISPTITLLFFLPYCLAYWVKHRKVLSKNLTSISLLWSSNFLAGYSTEYSSGFRVQILVVLCQSQTSTIPWNRWHFWKKAKRAIKLGVFKVVLSLKWFGNELQLGPKTTSYH